MPRKPKDQLRAGRDFYARQLPAMDNDHFAPLWHLFTVGHLVANDLDAVAREMGYSFADFDLLGTLAIDERDAVRATDLASTLYVSNAVISTRISRLERDGLVERRRSASDARAFELRLTAKGRALIEEAITRIAQKAKIVRFFRQLEADDRQALVRILGDLHQRYDREFPGGPYRDA